MPVLLRPQDGARPPDLQVPQGKFESGAKLGELLQGTQALFRLLAEDHILRNGEVTVGQPVRPPDPAAELVELGQAEAVGAARRSGC